MGFKECISQNFRTFAFRCVGLRVGVPVLLITSLWLHYDNFGATITKESLVLFAVRLVSGFIWVPGFAVMAGYPLWAMFNQAK